MNTEKPKSNQTHRKTELMKRDTESAKRTVTLSDRGLKRVALEDGEREAKGGRMGGCG